MVGEREGKSKLQVQKMNVRHSKSAVESLI